MDHDGICAAPRILFIDAYDSFANNIVALLQLELGARVTTIHIDDPNFTHRPPQDFYLYLHAFDAVVAGPGPGTVANPRDTGLISALWSLPGHHLLPVLGICLGFQSLAYAHGADVQRLPEPRHGIVTNVLHRGSSLFDGLQQVNATQYHSLHVNLGFPSIQASSNCFPEDLWAPSPRCPDLRPLAWDCDSFENGPVLMSVRHNTKPFWGVQYHPESICTDPEGAKIIQNWWNQARSWLSSYRPRHLRATSLDSPKKLRKLSTVGHEVQKSVPDHIPSAWNHLSCSLLQSSLINRPGIPVAYECLYSPQADVRRICELLGIPGDEAVVLESGLNRRNQPVRAETGNTSIIGCLEKERNLRVEYFVDGHVLELWSGRELIHREDRTDIWSYLKHLMVITRVAEGPVDSPFWGGMIGFTSYEAGLETINVKPTPVPGRPQASGNFRKPDLSFAFVTRSVVVDHVSHKVYVQSVRDGDSSWVRSTTSAISALASQPPPKPTVAEFPSLLACSSVTIPTQPSYEGKVRSCQESIRAGDSYELCLTSQTTISLPPSPSAAFPWYLYTRLRHLNPAPFGAYIRLGPPGAGVNIISSSPERFLSWTRQGLCQYRPIKGTVRKEAGVTRADAERTLNSSKERAENLMIVDLVRHDLHGVAGAGNVRVSKLMGVEEYETVWQLVSVIEGDLTGSWAREQLGASKHRSEHLPPQSPAAASTAAATTSDDEDSDHLSAAASSSSSSLAASPSLSPCPDLSASHPLHSSSQTLPRSRARQEKSKHQEKHPQSDARPSASGIDILHASLPPGSMTGAPKKRSCELLHAIEEGQPRGIYSGVLGYLDVGGGGDFSVVIRTAWRWDEERAGDGKEVWRVGAGGAVTAQSTPEGEYGEMLVKLESALRVFDGSVQVDD